MSGSADPTAATTQSVGPPRLEAAEFFRQAAVDCAAEGFDGHRVVTGWTGHVDRWLTGLFDWARTGVPGDWDGVALVAVGGYGRAELCPSSDLDVMLLHASASDVGALAERLWYPVWDEGVKLGHAVRTRREALALANEDLDTATSLLAVRHLAGDPDLTGALASAAVQAWEKNSRRWLGRLAETVEERHERAGEVAFHLEPDLKSGRGGLRDVHALHWASQAREVLLADDQETLDDGYGMLLDARVALHLTANRPTDILALQEQDEVAATMGLDADELMAQVAAAGRAIAWRSDETWDRVRSKLAGPSWGFARKQRALGDGLVMRDREVHLTESADPSKSPELALTAAAAAAERDIRIGRDSLTRLAAETPLMLDPWPPAVLAALVKLLLVGHAAVGQIESLDQLGIWGRFLPEWEPVRSCPQRNAYHRFTVDRHLCEAAANASGLTERVSRPDLLVLGALFHDIGKGRPGDHTEVGMILVAELGRRMGLSAVDTGYLVAMVRHHLLLPDVATRRDLSDPDTITAVAEAVGSFETLQLLDALTEADSRATGPAAWGPWKAGLLAELVDRTAERLGAPPRHDLRPKAFPSPEQQALLDAGERAVRAHGHELTVVAVDRPGLFNRVSGVLSLHGLAVRSADLLSGDDGMALEQITVASPRDEPIDWPKVSADLDRALAGRLAIPARLAERSRAYAHSDRHRHEVETRVIVDNGVTGSASVIEVHAGDSIGLLYRITRAMADLDLDIRSAKVQTLGETVVDAFYVLGPDRAKITDPQHIAEVDRALTHAVDGERFRA